MPRFHFTRVGAGGIAAPLVHSFVQMIPEHRLLELKIEQTTEEVLSSLSERLPLAPESREDALVPGFPL